VADPIDLGSSLKTRRPCSALPIVRNLKHSCHDNPAHSARSRGPSHAAALEVAGTRTDGYQPKGNDRTMLDATTRQGNGPDKPPKDKALKLRISYNGIERVLEVREADPISAVLQSAIQLFTVAEQPHQLGLFRESTGLEVTVDGQTVGTSGLKHNERLLLRPRAVSGG
jgi:hypothetical protein